MTDLYKSLTTPPPRYYDRKFNGTKEEYFQKLDSSCTLYVGNLSFYTTEEQIYELFSAVGDVKKIIMGIDKKSRTPCGFCFIEYYERSSAESCMKYINGTSLDERRVRTDWDPGFSRERQFGRGQSGGQVRDEYRPEYDAGRGGYGRQYQQRDEPQAYTEFQGGSVPTGKRGRGDDEQVEDEASAKNPRFNRGEGDEEH